MGVFVLAGEGDAAQQTPVLQVGAIAASAVLQVCRCALPEWRPKCTVSLS